MHQRGHETDDRTLVAAARASAGEHRLAPAGDCRDDGGVLASDTGRSAAQSSPRGTFNSSTMIVMMIASTPSLNASSRLLFMFRAVWDNAPRG